MDLKIYASICLILGDGIGLMLLLEDLLNIQMLEGKYLQLDMAKILIKHLTLNFSIIVMNF